MKKELKTPITHRWQFSIIKNDIDHNSQHIKFDSHNITDKWTTLSGSSKMNQSKSFDRKLADKTTKVRCR